MKLLPVCLYLDLAKRIFKRQFNYFFFILLYQMKNNKTIINEFEKALILFAEISKREVFSKGPRSKQSYDRLLLEIKTPQAIVSTKGTSIPPFMYCVGILRCHAITFLLGRCSLFMHPVYILPSEGGFVTSRTANSMYPKLPNNRAARLLIFQKKSLAFMLFFCST